MHEFLDLAKSGHNSWKRYLAAFLLFAFVSLVVSVVAAIAMITVLVVVSGEAPELASIAATQQILSAHLPPAAVLFLMIGPLPIMLATLWLLVARIHRRPFKSLVTGKRPIDWQRIWLGGIVWLGFALVAALIDPLLGNGTITYGFDAGQWIAYVPVAFVLIVAAASFEELLFRGYLTQALGLLTRRYWVLFLLPSLLFAVMHLGNPEVGVNSSLWLSFAYYLSFGLFFAAMTFRTGTLELALGAHAANNLVALVIGYPSSALTGPAIFQTTASPFTWLSFVVFLVLAAMYWFLIVEPRRVGASKK